MGARTPEASIDLVAEPVDTRSPDFFSALANDRSMASAAFRSLPGRWQEILWYSEVERLRPAEIGPLLGMKPNAVAALALRAREGLRQRWIQAHLRSSDLTAEHRWVIERAGRYTRGALSAASRRAVDDHLDACPECRAAYAELEPETSRIGVILLGLVLGSAASAYAEWTTSLPAAATGLRLRVRQGGRLPLVIASTGAAALVTVLGGSIVVAAVMSSSVGPAVRDEPKALASAPALVPGPTSAPSPGPGAPTSPPADAESAPAVPPAGVDESPSTPPGAVEERSTVPPTSGSATPRVRSGPTAPTPAQELARSPLASPPDTSSPSATPGPGSPPAPSPSPSPTPSPATTASPSPIPSPSASPTPAPSPAPAPDPTVPPSPVPECVPFDPLAGWTPGAGLPNLWCTSP